MTERLQFVGLPAGMGSILIQMSFLLSIRPPVEIFVSDPNNLAFAIKQIWQIPDDRLIVTLGENPRARPWIPSDELCTYSPYLYKDTIHLYGKKFQIGQRGKPCVALCMHHGDGLGEELTVKSMPYNKYRTQEEYQQIFQKLCGMGYDPIVINNREVDLEQKTYLLNELCEFVIGYEGGLHHLAHCLGIPCIVLPWRYNDLGGDPVYPGMYYETHRFHADKKTYLLNTVDEFLEMTDQQIRDLICQLHDGKGNNILWYPTVIFDPETLKIRCRDPYIDLTPRICWCDTYGAQTVEFIREHLPPENMRRYPVDQ